MKKPTLLVLAAGMGSRYGGLKQMDAFGPNGETILDYSIYDAIREGFGKVVFVIRESFNKEFRAFFANKFEDKIDIEYVFQSINNVPDNYAYHPDREKPWGTAHAVWVAKDVIDGPFAVINADDFYGRDSYRILYDYFDAADSTHNYALVGYQLEKTLSDYGTVNRGVCATHDDHTLDTIVETLKIGYDDDRKIFYNTDNGEKAYLSADTPVSMNMWAFFPDYFEHCETMFREFLQDRGQEMKSEFFIPLLVDHLINEGIKKVDVLECTEEWFGVTYKEDKPFVMDRLNTLIDKGVYPAQLWPKRKAAN